MRVTDGNLQPWPSSAQQITSPSNTGLTVPKDVKGREPTKALLDAEAQDIRWLDDGQAPTTTFGELLTVGNAFLYTGDLHAIRFTAAVAGGQLNVSFYR